MAYRTRIKYTDEMRSYIWDRYQQGDAVKAIARSFDRPSSSIHRQLALTGGIRPPDRKRSRHCLSLEEREDISRGLVAGLSLRAIACGLGRAPSTVSREVSRNGGAHLERWELAMESEREAICAEALGLAIGDTILTECRGKSIRLKIKRMSMHLSGKNMLYFHIGGKPYRKDGLLGKRDDYIYISTDSGRN